MSSETRSIIAVLKEVDVLHDVVEKLNQSSFKERISVISKSDVKELSDIIDTSAEKKAASGAGIGATAGTIVGILGGVGIIVPVVGLGSVLAAGIIGSASGASIGAYLGAIYSARFAEETKYDIQEALQSGAYLLIVNVEGLSEEEVEKAQSLIKKQNVEIIGTAVVNFDSLDE